MENGPMLATSSRLRWSPAAPSVFLWSDSQKVKPKLRLGLEAENHRTDVNNCMALRA